MSRAPLLEANGITNEVISEYSNCLLEAKRKKLQRGETLSADLYDKKKTYNILYECHLLVAMRLKLDTLKCKLQSRKKAVTRVNSEWRDQCN